MPIQNRCTTFCVDLLFAFLNWTETRNENAHKCSPLFAFCFLLFAHDFTLDQETYSFPSAPVQVDSKASYLAALQVDHLYDVIYNTSTTDLIDLCARFEAETNTSLKPSGFAPVNLWLFVVSDSEIYTSVDMAEVKGFLINYYSSETDQYFQAFARKDSQLPESLFLKQGLHSRFVANENLSTEDVRAFHFASIHRPPLSLPTNSAMIGFVDYGFDSGQTYHEDRSTDLYLDPNNDTGKRFSTYYQGDVLGSYSFINQNFEGNHGPENTNNCGGGSSMCPEDPVHRSCNAPGQYCYTREGNCNLRALIEDGDSNGFVKPSITTLNATYKLRDTILGNSPRGKLYIKLWYSYSKHIRLWDSSQPLASWNRFNDYMYLLNSIPEVLGRLEEPSSQGGLWGPTPTDPRYDAPVIVDSALARRFISVIQDHYGISSELDSHLETIERDINYMTGMNRDEFIDYLNYRNNNGTH